MARRQAREEPAVLKRRYPLEAVIARAGVRLRRSGGRLVGHCPFHDDRTPSFTVYPDQASYHCFGCGAHGDVFTFIMARERCSFAEAVARLTGGDLTPTPRPLAAPVEPGLTDRQAAILTAVARAYADDLTAARARDADAAALAYLRGRGVRDDVLAPAHVGWCAGDRLADLADGHGWAEAELVDLGLLDERGRERLAGRVVVPELRGGRCTWLTGRMIGPDHPRRPKYLGIRAPRRAHGLERAAGQPVVIVVEGVIDYLVGLGWGLPTLGLGGLGLRPDELAFLRHARELVLVLDADRAGRAEAARLAALIGARARVVAPPPPAKDLADLALLPDGRERLMAQLARAASPR